MLDARVAELEVENQALVKIKAGKEKADRALERAHKKIALLDS
jgi:outer membrane murein-binding lipoprotein Lpp